MNKEEIKKIIKKEECYKAFEYRDYKCRILRPHSMSSGESFFINLCGYIGIPKDHIYHGMNSEDMEIYIHGGITYYGNSLMYQPETDLWWIGFDCCHLNDIWSLEHHELFVEKSSYKDMEFVENELKKAVDQIINNSSHRGRINESKRFTEYY